MEQQKSYGNVSMIGKIIHQVDKCRLSGFKHFRLIYHIALRNRRCRTPDGIEVSSIFLDKRVDETRMFMKIYAYVLYL